MSNDFQVNTNEYLAQCDSRDVVSFESENLVSVGKLKHIVNQSFYEYAVDEIIATLSNHPDLKNSGEWFYEGEECEILKADSMGWQKGKLKINVTLEFIPDEPEENKSPLDDVRQQIDLDDR